MSCEDRLWNHFLQPRSAVGLAVFRMVYSLTLLCEVLQLYHLRHLVFDTTPYLAPAALSVEPLLWAWIGSILCLFLGLFTRQSTIVNYVATLATFSVTGYWEYHVDYVYTGIGFFLLFIPVEQTLSLDAWRAGRQAARDRKPLPPTSVPRVHYDALILVGIAIVYLDSVFYKLASPMWMAGLGMWRPASLPHITFWDLGWLLDLKLLMISLGYLTLVFEVTFIVTMWFDRLRPLLLVIGMGLHLGIVMTFPIPWFGLAVAALYFLLVPDTWWQWLGSKRSASSPHSRSPLTKASSATPVSTTSTTPDRRVRTTAAIVATSALIVTVAQLLQTSRAFLTRNLAASLGIEAVHQPFVVLAERAAYASRTFLGVTPHPVFMDFHFDGYESFYTLVYVAPDGKQVWLPMSNEQGQGSLFWSGRLWVNWTWRVSNPQPTASRMMSGLRHVSAWWLGHHHLGFENQTFLLMRRACDSCDGWREGYYQEQLDHEWQPVGTVQWSNGECKVTLEQDALIERVNTTGQ